MLDKIKNKIFPCEQILRQVRMEHCLATQGNTAEHEKLKTVCIAKMYPQFAHVDGKNVSPR